jgi:hypothetical protein
MVQVGMGTHPKLGQLTDSERCAHVFGVLAVASLSPVRGLLLVGNRPVEPTDVARMAGVSPRVAASTIHKLQEAGAIEHDEEFGCLRVHDWEDVNPEPKADRTHAERQRRYRERHAQRDATSDGHSDANVTPTEVKKEKEDANASSRRGSAADADATEDDHRLCRLLADLAKQRNPKFKVKSRSRWLTDMRRLRKTDGNSPDEIERAIRWTFTSTHKDAQFWAGVIQSPGNLREHFAQIWDRMNGTTTPGTSRVESVDAFLARRGAA